MAWVNENFTALQDSYLFSQVAHKVAAYSAAHPEQKIIRLGIGDVTLPLAPVVVEAMQKAAADLDFTAAARYRDEMWALQEYLKVWKDKD